MPSSNRINTIPYGTLILENGTPTTGFLGFMNSIFQAFTRTPRIYTSTAAPSTAPTGIGDIYIKTDTGKIYVSSATSSSSDWQLLN